METSLTIPLEPLATALGRPLSHVKAAVQLLDEGNTIPFVARYRKEATGGMDDEELRTLSDQLEKLRALESRRADILRLLEEQGNLTTELAQEVREADTLQRLEDLYRPYRPRRTTRASLAKERGLEPLAEWLLQRSQGDPETEAEKYISDAVPDVQAALQGARDIVAERLSDDAALRERLREIMWQTGLLCTKTREAERSAHYAMYADYSEPVRRVPPHRILAINRGEREDALTVRVEPDAARCEATVRQAVRGLSRRSGGHSPADEHLDLAAVDALKRLLLPSLEREVRAALTEKGEEQAYAVFRENLRSLLLQPPLRGHVVMGLDPAFRTGVKVAIVSPTGRLLTTGVIYPTAPHHRTEEAAEQMTEWVRRYEVTAIAIGNGTASRETEQFVAAWIKTLPTATRPAYAIVNEAGASVYSASPLAKEEFPALDVSERSAVSIARRLQDPLAELVKIEPRSLGVGQYQHDVDTKRLAELLRGVVEASVNQVGVDLNTASVALLSYVAGVGSQVAQNIVAYRDEHGPFTSRRQLLDVKRLGPRTFEQCAGFLRIPDAPYPLDRTPIDPESYSVAEGLLAALGLSLEQVGQGDAVPRVLGQLSDRDITRLAQELGCGAPTLRDIVEALMRPGRDLRDDLPPPELRSDVLAIEDLREGMVLTGIVRNVVDFGVFVDVGVQQDGLVHISELSDRYVKHPLDVVSVGETVRVRVLQIDQERGRIALSMKGVS